MILFITEDNTKHGSKRKPSSVLLFFMKILLFRASVAQTFNLPLTIFLMLPLLGLYVNPGDSNKSSRSLLRRVQGNCIHGSRIISSRSKCVRIIFSKYVTYLT